MPAAGGGAGYHALTFICYKVISPVRHTVSLAISAGLVKRMERTRPWYFKTSSDIVKEAKETGGEVKERYSEKMAEGREKYNEKMAESRERYNEKIAEGREKYNEKIAEGREKVEDMKNIAREKRDDIREKYDDWRKKS